MSVRRVYKWQCDNCQISEETMHGLPKCWICAPPSLHEEGESTLHFCGLKCCHERLPKDQPDKDEP